MNTVQMPPPQPVPAAKPPERWFILAGVWLVYLGFGLTISALAPLVPPIMAEFAMTHTGMGGILGAWQIVYFFAAIPCGLLVDRLGPRRALFLAAMIMTLTGVARSLAVDPFTLALAVAIFGLGGPMIASGAPKMISLWFSGPERGLAMGIYVTGPAVAGMVTLAGTHAVMMPMLDQNWRHVLLAWAVVTFVAGMAWLVISGLVDRAPASPQMQGRPAVGPEVMPEAKRSETGREAFAALLADRSVRLILLIGLCIFTFVHGITHWLPELLRAGGMGVVEAGYWAALPTVVGVIGALFIPRLATPDRRLPLMVLLSLGAVTAALCLNADKGPVLATGLVLQGIARSTLMTVAILTLIELPAVGQARAGAATGLFFTTEGLGGMLGPLVIGVTHDLSGSYAAGLIALALAPATIAISALMLRRRTACEPVP